MQAYNALLPLTPDVNAERLAQLKQLMPDLFTNEGKLNPDEVRKLAEPDGIPETERYEFRWFGKTQAKRNAFTPGNATLVLDEKRSCLPNPGEEPRNLVIEGENLEVLKLLLAGYREKVKCIYIDPPYNTGKDFVYSDNYTEGRKPYWEQTGVTDQGVKIDTNTDADGRYHSNWLNMMYSRLLLARQLLREDGVIFVSIDDNEVTNLRKLMDEVFGEENFVACLVWERGRKNDAKLVSVGHEYVMVYMKFKNSDTIWREEKPGASDILKQYKLLKDQYQDDHNKIQAEIRKFYDDLAKVQPDHPALKHRRYNRIDKNGIWRDDNISWPNVGGPSYDVIHPKTGQACKVPDTGWRFSTLKKFKLYEENGFIFYREDHTEPPMLKRYLNYVSMDFDPDVKRRSNADDSADEVNVQVMPSVFYKSAQPTVIELRSLMEADVFQNPKDPELLQRWISLVTNKNDIILDFFGGSGSTGQAVMELNEEDGGTRQFILVQMPEATDQGSEAYKAGYKKISDITIERNRRVVEKLNAARQEKAATLFDGDNPPLPALGFKVYKLRKSNFPRTEWTPDPARTEAENLATLQEYIRLKESQLVTMFNKRELMTEILLKQGFTLHFTAQVLPEFAKNEVYVVTEGTPEPAGPSKKGKAAPVAAPKQVLLCLDGRLENETLEYLRTHTDRKFICLERALDTTKKWNLKHYLGDNFYAF